MVRYVPICTADVTFVENNAARQAVRTDEWYTRWRDPGQQLTIIAEVFVRVDGHLASAQQSHGPLIDLLPSPLKTSDWRRIQARDNGYHA